MTSDTPSAPNIDLLRSYLNGPRIWDASSIIGDVFALADAGLIEPVHGSPAYQITGTTGGTIMTTSAATYDHPRYGELAALPGTGPGWSGWLVVATTMGSGNFPLGSVVDSRADDGIREASPVAPDDDDAQPFDAFGPDGGFITSTHSLRGALAVIGNHA